MDFYHQMRDLMNIRATHPHGFRFGEWAEVTGVEWDNHRPCFKVRFVDGRTDTWPIYDPSDPYEFRGPYREPTPDYGMTVRG